MEAREKQLTKLQSVLILNNICLKDLHKFPQPKAERGEAKSIESQTVSDQLKSMSVVKYRIPEGKNLRNEPITSETLDLSPVVLCAYKYSSCPDYMFKLKFNSTREPYFEFTIYFVFLCRQVMSSHSLIKSSISVLNCFPNAF